MPEDLPSQDMVTPLTAEYQALVARRERAAEALAAMNEVLEVEVHVPHLVELARGEEPTQLRLNAKRALRCLTAIGRPDSEVMRAIGDQGIYPYVEGVLIYGADQQKYLELMREYDLTAEQTTGLYAVREIIQQTCHGRGVGFREIVYALRKVGIAPQDAGYNPEETVAVLDEAGFFVDHAGGVAFDRPVFIPGGWVRPLSHYIDTQPSDIEGTAWARGQLEQRRFRLDEEED